MKLVVGLGNPGKKYQNTRHNLGFIVLENFAKKHQTKINKKKFKSLIAEIKLAKKILLIEPQTYMNLSGEAVIAAKKFYKIKISDIIIIHDDLDLLPGSVRYREKGSSGGHNGLKSIIECLGSKDFARIKIGIGKPKNKQDIEKYVLYKIDDEKIYDSLDTALDKLEDWIKK